MLVAIVHSSPGIKKATTRRKQTCSKTVGEVTDAEWAITPATIPAEEVMPGSVKWNQRKATLIRLRWLGQLPTTAPLSNAPTTGSMEWRRKATMSKTWCFMAYGEKRT